MKSLSSALVIASNEIMYVSLLYFFKVHTLILTVFPIYICTSLQVELKLDNHTMHFIMMALNTLL